MAKKQSKRRIPAGWVKLTDFETGKPVYLNRSELRSVREVYDDFEEETPTELGERTRIDTLSDVILVRESAAEVLGIEA